MKSFPCLSILAILFAPVLGTLGNVRADESSLPHDRPLPAQRSLDTDHFTHWTDLKLPSP